jgi:hypothetical protein
MSQKARGDPKAAPTVSLPSRWWTTATWPPGIEGRTTIVNANDLNYAGHPPRAILGGQDGDREGRFTMTITFVEIDAYGDDRPAAL